MSRTGSLAFIPAFVFACALLSGCNTAPDPAPGEPELAHNGTGLVLYPGDASEESLFVKNAKPGEWTLSLFKAPPRTTLKDGKITYLIPAGLEGLQEVHAIATDGKGKLLDLVWTVTAMPDPNLPPTILYPSVPAWIVAGTRFRFVVKITDPEGGSITLHKELPDGAVFTDSILEWTPTAGQVGMFKVLFDAYDAGGHRAAEQLSLTVRAYDPEPFTAAISAGRNWWIRGYSINQTPDKRDSVFLRRQVSILSADSASGTFAFRLIDTVSIGGTDSISDSVYAAVSRAGFGFAIQGKGGTRSFIQSEAGLPFHWPPDDPVFQNTAFAIQGKSYPALRQIQTRICRTKYGCDSHEYFYVSGLGRVSLKQEQENVVVLPGTALSAFDVWAVSGP